MNGRNYRLIFLRGLFAGNVNVKNRVDEHGIVCFTVDKSPLGDRPELSSFSTSVHSIHVGREGVKGHRTYAF